MREITTNKEDIITGKFKVYCHKNKINNKLYFGITSQTLNARWRKGKGYKKGVFYRAIQKYGWDNFNHIVLLENISEECAKEIEKYLIKKYNSIVPFGYNTTKGGDSIFIRTFTDEERYIKRIMMSGENNPMYNIRLVGDKNPMYGRHHSDSAKEKMSQSKIGNNFRKGKQTSETAKRKISIANKERLKDKRNHPMYGKTGINNPNYGHEGIGKKSVLLVNTGEVFDSVTDASIAYNITPTEVSRCCHNRQKSAGKDKNGEKLVWKFNMQKIGGDEHCIY